MPRTTSGTTTPVGSPAISRPKGTTAIPTVSKFSFKSAFASKASKPAPTSAAVPASPSKRNLQQATTNETVRESSALPGPTTAPDSSLRTTSKLPTSSATLRSKPLGPADGNAVAAETNSSLGKRRGGQADSDDPQAPALASGSAATTGSTAGEFGIRARSKISTLKSKLPGPPPARFGTFSGQTPKPGTASPAGKLMKVARSNSLRDVHGAPGLQTATRPQDPVRTTAVAATASGSHNPTPRDTPAPKAGTLPKPRGRVGSTLPLRTGATIFAAGEDESRKRTQSITEGIASPSPLRKGGVGTPTQNSTSPSIGRSFKSTSVAVGTKPNVSGSASNAPFGTPAPLLRKLPSQRRPSSVDLGKAHSADSVQARRTSTSKAAATQTEAAKTSGDKENQAVSKVGPPPSFPGPAARMVRKSSTSLRQKRSSLPVATTLLAAAACKDQELQDHTTGDEAAEAGRQQTAPTPPATLLKPQASTGSLNSIASGEKPNLGIASSILKAHPITHPTVLAMRQRVPHQPIDTPQALMKGKRRLSGVVANPLDLTAVAPAAATEKALASGKHESDKRSQATATATAAASATTTPPVSPSKAVKFPSTGSPGAEPQASRSKPHGLKKPNSRALSSAEIDADLLASLQAVACKANLGMKEVESLLAADKLQRQAESADRNDAPAEPLEAGQSSGSWAALLDRKVSAACETGERRRGGVRTPSSGGTALPVCQREGSDERGGQASRASGRDDLAESIGDQSFDLFASQPSPLATSSPLLGSSKTPSPPPTPTRKGGRPPNEADDRGRRRSSEENGAAPAPGQLRRALRESVGLEAMLRLRSSSSQHESLLSIDLDGIAPVGETAAERPVGKEKPSGMLMDESCMEELEGTDATMDLGAPKAGRERRARPVGMRADATDAGTSDATAALTAQMREMEAAHARQLAELEGQVAALASRLSQTGRDGTPSPSDPGRDELTDGPVLAEVQQALSVATASLASSNHSLVELEGRTASLQAALEEAEAERVTTGWKAVQRLGLVEMQEVRSQMDTCIFWKAQLDMWERMVGRAVRRRRRDAATVV